MLPSAPVLPFAVATALSAFLLFQVEPLIAKYILPWFGGFPAVWTTCMLFFQLALLAGYAYAHFLVGRWTPKRQALVHVAVLLVSLAFLPIAPDPAWKPAGETPPIPRILALLTVTIGMPFFVLSSTGPLLQGWLVRSDAGRHPYRLYALSNLGSLLALASYPVAVEPYLRLDRQARTWSVGYGLFAVVCAWCAYRAAVWPRPVADPAVSVADPPAGLPDGSPSDNPTAGVPCDVRRPRWTEVILWLLLAAFGSLALLAATNQLCQDIAVVPFLWVLPLALYLLSFIICFDNERWYHRGVFGTLFLVGFILAYAALVRGVYLDIRLQVLFGAVAVFACCMVCHGELARRKPHPRYLTGFYLAVAVGGALGGLFVALAAPFLFEDFWEFHLGLAGCLVLLVVTFAGDDRGRRGLACAALGLLVLAALLVALNWADVRATADSLKAEWLTKALKGLRVFCSGHRIFARSLIPCAVLGVVLLAMDRRVRFRWTAWTLSLPLLIAAFILLGEDILDDYRIRYHSTAPERLGSAPNRTGPRRVARWLRAWRYRVTTVYPLVDSRRNFYGVLKLRKHTDGVGKYYCLSHGRIEHGCQYLDKDKRGWPTTYYGHKTGIGKAVDCHPRRLAGEPLSLGVVGLGAGTIAALGMPCDTACFYEINPNVLHFATHYFTYTHGTGARTEVVLGDARVSMERELRGGKRRNFDVLAIDAFSSDAIPMHLLTRECFSTYLRHLKPDGLLAVHVSNRYLKLGPIVRALAEERRLSALLFDTTKDDSVGVNGADWVVATSNGLWLGHADVQAATTEWKKNEPPGPAWTDDYGSLVHALRR